MWLALGGSRVPAGTSIGKGRFSYTCSCCSFAEGLEFTLIQPVRCSSGLVHVDFMVDEADWLVGKVAYIKDGSLATRDTSVRKGGGRP